MNDDHMTYHMATARRQILVQMEDELVDQLDELVQQTGQNRSELIRRAARSLVAGFENVEKDRRLVEGYRRHPQDADFAEAALKLAVETWPEW